jgi:DMSO reductase family type II enzyme heme b subunit|tara:strand:+ start:802 stop:1452 length:651 start_codon:yes stop_codon:yes gene_type:complete
MRVPYFKTLSQDDLLDPLAVGWSGVNSEHVPLTGTPVDMQPTAYIRTKWKNQQPGRITRVRLKAMHNGETLAFHLQWAVPSKVSQTRKPGSFPDAAAIAFGTDGGSSFHTMGASGSPLNIWHWRADAINNGRQVTAAGIGTTEAYADRDVKASARQAGNGWQVVIARNFESRNHDLKMGDRIKCAVAIWDGNSEERGGLKAYSPSPLTINISDEQV